MSINSFNFFNKLKKYIIETNSSFKFYDIKFSFQNFEWGYILNFQNFMGEYLYCF